MKKLVTILRKIIRARALHTERFTNQQFDRMHNKDAATAPLWDEFTLNCRRIAARLALFQLQHPVKWN